MNTKREVAYQAIQASGLPIETQTDLFIAYNGIKDFDSSPACKFWVDFWVNVILPQHTAKTLEARREYRRRRQNQAIKNSGLLARRARRRLTWTSIDTSTD